MINKMELMRKIKKNRVLVLIVSAVVICGVYFAVQKAIDAYVFNNNSDIVFGSESSEKGEGSDADSNEEKANEHGDDKDEKNWFEKLFGEDKENVGEKQVESNDSDSADVSRQISADEVDLEVEAKDEGSSDAIESDVTDGLENDNRWIRRKNIC